jgi:hypothetical protein
VKKADDCSLSRTQRSLVRKHARAALENATAMGIFPTPVSAIMEKAQVILAEEDALADSFLQKMRRKAGSALRRAISKVIGVLDVVARVIYIDRTLYVVKQTFLKLHETAHAVLPWQRDIYAVTEDCEKTLAPEISEAFEREANVFASDVLFQLDTFTTEANDHDFGIKVPLNLHKKFGASIYSAIRRYVSENHRACAVVVINPPELSDGRGFSATLRRVIVSEQFAAQFGELNWPTSFTPGDEIGAMIPVGRRMSRPRHICLVDRNGARHECIAEAFTQTHQVFVLIHAAHMLTRMTVVLA